MNIENNAAGCDLSRE